MAFFVWIVPSCFGQVITIRVINARNGHPLTKRHIVVSQYDEKSEKGSHLRLETDVHGEARLTLPDPIQTRLSVVVLLKSRSWQCDCLAYVATKEVVQSGIMKGQSLRESATSTELKPEEIIFVARRRPFFEQLLVTLLAPLME